MDAKRGLTGTIVGAVVIYGVGYLIFNVLAANYYAAHAGSATGVNRTPQLIWAVALGSVTYAALITWAMMRRPGSTSIGQGAMIGAIVGFLAWGTADVTLYGITNINSLTIALLDPCLEAIHAGLAGAAIAAVAGKANG